MLEYHWAYGILSWELIWWMVMGGELFLLRMLFVNQFAFIYLYALSSIHHLPNHIRL